MIYIIPKSFFENKIALENENEDLRLIRAAARKAIIFYSGVDYFSSFFFLKNLNYVFFGHDF